MFLICSCVLVCFIFLAGVQGWFSYLFLGLFLLYFFFFFFPPWAAQKKKKKEKSFVSRQPAGAARAGVISGGAAHRGWGQGQGQGHGDSTGGASGTGQVLLGPQPQLEQGMVAGPSACPLC